ncbi:alpha/beta hydrolase, partial [bacterium]|nr:alpha/beta hydrolase [bacterium]
GTGGTPAENAAALAKARFDAEYLWYQGNASIDVQPDSLFDAAAEPDRNVILYGNADTNAAWRSLWNDTVTVTHDGARVGERTLRGDDVGMLAVQPRPGSDVALVGIVAASGAKGMRLLHRRPYLLPHVSYPDLTVFRDMGDDRVVRAAGFFGNDWSLERGVVVWADDRP